jgi:CheY-like chemotaxis protein
MPTWLLVEDEPDMYDTLLALFALYGSEGIAFNNGADAVDWIEYVDNGALTTLPELALLDVRLPEKSGPDIGLRLRQSPYLKHIPIVLLTAYHLSPDEEVAVLNHAQADRLLFKPLPAPNELWDILEDLIASYQD